MLDEEVPELELETSSGFVTPLPHPAPSMPTPARAIPPDNTFKNSRRSSRFDSSYDWGFRSSGMGHDLPPQLHAQITSLLVDNFGRA